MYNPLRYQMTEYDCGPTSLLNGISYLFPREDIPPELVRNVLLYCLDRYGADGGSGKRGTSGMAMQFLSSWLNGFGQAGYLPVSSRFVSGPAVTLSQNGLLRDALHRRGAAVVQVDFEGWHYVLLTAVQDGQAFLFDPYFRTEPFQDPQLRIDSSHPLQFNRIVPVARLEQTGLLPYAMGPKDRREAVLLFNESTRLTPENTVEYMI